MHMCVGELKPASAVATRSVMEEFIQKVCQRLRGGQKGPQNKNCNILAILTPETASGAVVIKT